MKSLSRRTGMIMQTLLDPNRSFIFTSNLKYKVMLTPYKVVVLGYFIPYVSLPELESAMTVWEMMEMIHSRSPTSSRTFTLIPMKYSVPFSTMRRFYPVLSLLQHLTMSLSKPLTVMIPLTNTRLPQKCGDGS